jgi:hypothetical protein
MKTVNQVTGLISVTVGFITVAGFVIGTFNTVVQSKIESRLYRQTLDNRLGSIENETKKTSLRIERIEEQIRLGRSEGSIRDTSSNTVSNTDSSSYILTQ